MPKFSLQQPLDVVKGRSEHDLKDYLLQLKGREKVQVICMDLSRSYRKIVKEYFPNAKIVSDRFHVIRLLNHQTMQAYHQIDPELKYQRGLLGILRSVSDDRLSAKQKQQRELYFKRFAKAEKINQLKEKLYHLLMKKSCQAKRCKRLIPLLLGYLQRLSSPQPFESLLFQKT